MSFAKKISGPAVLFTITCFLFTSVLSCGAGQDTANSSAQNRSLPPSPITYIDNLYSIDSKGGSSVWCAGYYGKIYHSSNGGKDWIQQKSNTLDELYGVAFVNPKKGWVVGRHGTILHTADGGATWVAQTSPTKATLYEVMFVDEKNGWATGYGMNGIIIHTADGGASWSIQKEDEDRLYNSLYFADTLNGWVVGEYGTIYHTTDNRRGQNLGKTRERGWHCLAVWTIF